MTVRVEGVRPGSCTMQGKKRSKVGLVERVASRMADATTLSTTQFL